ncbi:hypothetical protein L1987_86192 [Smallanthus sonchifolius]|uniref:Uncharacterized protein n=1 Tax=Smallanthus sonchifolius TaxID=185202 RepID=A0ACB8XZP1_9ASTR|nr:hypothetical protein L1987_86192 [Smallanthus sonchifolius]
MKYVLVTGGVVSGLGKGVTASSIGVVLKASGLRVTSIKIDPYLNTDAGTMSPFEHGEVFVLDDGGEVDLDLGNYERFLDVRLTRDNNITTGKIYQVIPHITDAIMDLIESVAAIPVDGKVGPADVCVIELGGTVGDIESMPFIEALRQLFFSKGPDNFCLIHVSLVPVLGVVGEQFTLMLVISENKTYTTQCSGTASIRPDPSLFSMSVCSAVMVTLQPLLETTKQKLSQFCHVPVASILNIHDVPNIWHVPLLLRNQNAHEAILKQLALLCVAIPPNLQEWTTRAETFDNLTNSVKIAMVGKYVGLTDSYLSVVKALLHACTALSLKPSIEWIAASDLEDESAKLTPEAHTKAWETLRNCACVLVPGGFGDRGVAGMILAAKYARENKVPYLGICLGMQISVIEISRSILGWKGANSTEFDELAPNPVVIFMPEVNPEVVGDLEKTGLRFVGKDESGQRMEILELPRHPFYLGVQFHPESYISSNREVGSICEDTSEWIYLIIPNSFNVRESLTLGAGRGTCIDRIDMDAWTGATIYTGSVKFEFEWACLLVRFDEARHSQWQGKLVHERFHMPRAHRRDESQP